MNTRCLSVVEAYRDSEDISPTNYKETTGIMQKGEYKAETMGKTTRNPARATCHPLLPATVDHTGTPAHIGYTYTAMKTE